MIKGLMLMDAGGLLFQACADTNSTPLPEPRSMIERANICATCGGTVQDNYFAGSTFRANPVPGTIDPGKA